MLRRQKLLLAILYSSERSLSPMELVKLVFLLRQEPEIKADHTFYDFVPYKFGPFSFALYRELEALQGNGYVQISDSDIAIVRPMLPDISRKIKELTSREQTAVSAVINRYGKLVQKALVRIVYSKYPWYTLNSELTDLVPKERPERPKAEIAVYTSGYEGKSVDAFFDRLVSTGIQTIVDVRFNPVSRKYGFAGSSMSRIGKKLGLNYIHLPTLGIAGKQRESLSDFDSYQRLLEKYSQELLPHQESTLTHLSELLQHSPSALVCMEKDVRCCHRGRLANVMGVRTKLPVVHL